MEWDAASTGGTAAIDPLGFPLIPLLVWLVALGCVALAVHFARRGTARGATGVAARLLGRAPTRGQAVARTLLLSSAWLVPVLVHNLWLRDWDPLSWSEPAGPGPQVADIRGDGWWQSESIEHARSWSWSPGEPCLTDCRGPRYVYRLRPGETYTVLSTVRNDGPVRVRLLGQPERENSAGPYGLALLRDPASTSTDPGNLRPFEPVELAPGDAVPVAIVETAPPCADPAAEVEQHNGPRGVGDAAASYTTRIYSLVYEVLAWRREGTIWPQFSVSLAGCEVG